MIVQRPSAISQKELDQRWKDTFGDRSQRPVIRNGYRVVVRHCQECGEIKEHIVLTTNTSICSYCMPEIFEEMTTMPIFAKTPPEVIYEEEEKVQEQIREQDIPQIERPSEWEPELHSIAE